eukprot:jgi/Picsp_1/6566/NSC_03909-R1_ku70 ku80 beta-barrel domain containing protein
MIFEKAVIVLDVGSMSKEYLEPATCAIGTFMHEKMINKPTHKVGLIVCGSNDEVLTVEECISLEPVTEKHLAALSGIESFHSAAATTRSSFDEGILKSIDLIHSDLPEKKKGIVREKIILVTCYRGEDSTRAKDSLTSLQESKIKLQIVQILQSSSEMGSSWIHEAVRDLDAEVKYVYSTYQMRTCFPVKQYSDMHVIYSHTLQIGAKTEISVKVSTKVRPEAFPGIGNMPIGTEFDSFEASMPSYDKPKSHDCFREDDFEQEIPIAVEKKIKGFRLGKTTVPISEPLAEEMKCYPDRSMILLGFLKEDKVRTEHFLGGSKILVADKSAPGAVSAIHALATALNAESQGALIRVVLRAGSAAKLYFATPRVTNPSYFVMNEIPYVEDLSSFYVEKIPRVSHDLTGIAGRLIDNMMLEDGCMEPERLANPVLHRAIAYFNDLYGDINAELPSRDVWFEEFNKAMARDLECIREFSNLA